jgi:hypothetical protein
MAIWYTKLKNGFGRALDRDIFLILISKVDKSKDSMDQICNAVEKNPMFAFEFDVCVLEF